eukprot:793830-Heterocapsa_arctica.AAC.1
MEEQLRVAHAPAEAELHHLRGKVLIEALRGTPQAVQAALQPLHHVGLAIAWWWHDVHHFAFIHRRMEKGRADVREPDVPVAISG